VKYKTNDQADRDSFCTGDAHEQRSNVRTRASAGGCKKPAGSGGRDEATRQGHGAFGTKAQGLPENEAVLRKFFKSFPDYSVELEGHASNGETLICWGTAGMTMTGNRFGVVPNGQRAQLPIFIQFTFKNDLIAREVFFFDLSALCAQSGVSTDAVRRKLFGETSPSAVAAR
jgi:predicted ester cyclase